MPSAKRIHKPLSNEVSNGYRIFGRSWKKFDLGNFSSSMASAFSTYKRQISVGLLVCLFLFLVWPTLWRYDKSGTMVARTNRITEEVQTLGYDGWQTKDSGWVYKILHPKKDKQRTSTPPVPEPNFFLTEDEINQLQWDGAILDPNGSLSINIYNGSSQSISNITLRIAVGAKSAKNLAIVRDYRLQESDASGCTPQSNCAFSTQQAYHLDGATQSWQIVGIENATILH